MPLASYDADASGIAWPNIMLHLILIIFSYHMKWYHWWHFWHYVALIPASLALHDQNIYIPHCSNCLELMNTVIYHIVSIVWNLWTQWPYWQCHWHLMMLMPVPTVSNDWKSHVRSHFNHYGTANAVVLLTMPSVSCYANTSITWPNMLCCTLFQVPWPSKIMVPLSMPFMMQLAAHGSSAGTNSIIWLKKSCFTLF